MKPRLLAALIGVSLATAACNPGSYPVDLFSEMHYTPSQKLLEPNRLAAPPDAVPTTGGRLRLPYSHAGSLANPTAGNPQLAASGAHLYAVNCSMCHGDDGHGDGPVARYFKERGTDVVPVPPPDFRDQLVSGYNDGQLYWIISNGVGDMPAFRNLLSDDQTWAVVTYLKDLQSRP